MTRELRLGAVKMLRGLRKGGIERKEAMLRVCQQYGICARSLYRYCRRYGARAA